MIITLAGYSDLECDLFEVIVPILSGCAMACSIMAIICLFGAGCGRRRKLNRPTATCIMIFFVISFFLEFWIIEQVFSKFGMIKKCLDEHTNKAKTMLGISMSVFIIYSIMCLYIFYKGFKMREVWLSK